MPPRASAAPAVRRGITGRWLWFLFRSVSELNRVEQSDTGLKERRFHEHAQPVWRALHLVVEQGNYTRLKPLLQL